MRLRLKAEQGETEDVGVKMSILGRLSSVHYIIIGTFLGVRL